MIVEFYKKKSTCVELRSICILVIVVFISSCSISKKISKSANQILIEESSLQSAHIGLSLYEPATQKYWYNYQSDKNFIPASNTKLFSLYAGLKYLGDSLPAAKITTRQRTLLIEPTGDPTFLHPLFTEQPLLKLMNQYDSVIINLHHHTVTPYGAGWAWDDFDQDYVSERSAFPVFGNQVWIANEKIAFSTLLGNEKASEKESALYITPSYFKNNVAVSETSQWHRSQFENQFFIGTPDKKLSIPFITKNDSTALDILNSMMPGKVYAENFELKKSSVIFSQPTDSMLKQMMYESDNFFAEQTLLMSSKIKLDVFDEKKMIDTLLKTDLKNMPSLPRWVDGSGLSRYNLFTPKSMVFIIEKMRNEFGLKRLQNILPKGGTGTLSNYYLADSGYIFAKTGTLSNQVALSGILLTKKNKLLIFSVLVGNHRSSATYVRRQVEKFIKNIRESY